MLDAEGKQVVDKYINEPVRLSNMVILPGSTVVIDDNEISMAGYMEEHGDI